MTPSRASVEHDLAIAMRDMAVLREEIATANAKLAVFQLAPGPAGSPQSTMADDMRRANEQLVLANLRDRAQADEIRAMLDDVRRLAECDELTGVPLRAPLLAWTTQALTRAQAHGARLAVLRIDLDQFRQVNERFGHAVGDDVLKQVALRLRAAVLPADCVGRHGGDEFVVVLTDLLHSANLQQRTSAVVAALQAPYRVQAANIDLRASIGISIYPDDGQDTATLLDHADLAMLRSRRAVSAGVRLGYAGIDAVTRGMPASIIPIALDPPRDSDDGGAEDELREANQQLVLAALDARQLQAAAELAHRRQKELLAVVAHELRTPLTPMRMAAGLLGELRPDLLPQLKSIIEREVRHMSRLIGDLLDMSRVHAGKLRLERRSIDLAAVIAESIDACRPAIDERSQSLHLHLAPGPVMLHGDAVRLAQVLRNLLDNSSKYTPVGGRIDLGLRRLKRRVVITVCDTGIGIRPEALPHVFDPFVQDPHAVGFNGAGLGIGLTVVRELVESHGGRVVARSAGSGRGSQFIVSLPCSPHPAAIAASA